MSETNYQKYRGKCKEFSELEIKKNPSLILVKGWYHCPIWGKQEHWWCKDKEGEIIDPTKLQFPSAGIGDYEEYKGILICEECGKEVKEEECIPMGRFAVCSMRCGRALVGV